MRGQGWLPLLPQQLPPLSLMLEDIGNPSPAAIAKALGVSRSTAYRWIAQEDAPRVVLLALYYVTKWGRSEVNCQAENDAGFYYTYAASLRTELAAANAKLARLGQIGDFGSANDPAPGVPATLHEAPPRPRPEPLKKTARQRRDELEAGSQKRAELAAQRLAARAEGPARPFDFLRAR